MLKLKFCQYREIRTALHEQNAELENLVPLHPLYSQNGRYNKLQLGIE